MTSRNINVFVTGGTKKLTLKDPFLTQKGTTIQLKSATVFWNFENVTSTNNKYAVGTSQKEIGTGYLDFELIKERLKEDKINLTAVIHDNMCDIENQNDTTVNLKKFGKLLGFPENQPVLANTVTRSPHSVDVNRGLRYLKVTCDLANPLKNVDTDGNTNTNISYLPIPPGTRLNSTVSSFNENHPVVFVKEDIVTEMTFTVTPNINIPVDVDVLLNLVVNGIHMEHT